MLRRALIATPLMLVTPALAQARAIRLIVPFPPGGSTDINGRIIAHAMAARLDLPMVVENRSGASGLVGIEAVAQSAPDGTTFGLLPSSTVLATAVLGRPYQPELLSFVGGIWEVAIVILVNPTVLPHVRDLASFLDHARAHPDSSYSSVGIGSMGHLCMEELKRLTGIRLTHVPYRGGAPAVTDLLSGVVPIMFSDMQSALGAIRGGAVRAIAVGSRNRSRFLPDVPTIAEQGLAGIEAVAFGGMVGRAGLPQEAIGRMAAALRAAIADPEVTARILDSGAEPSPSDGPTFKARLRRALDDWGPVIERSGVRGSAQ